MSRRAVLTALFALVPIPLCAGAAEERAQRILDAAGTRGGLIVHLGCGDGALTAALRRSDACVVHGLDPDPANVAKARERFRSLGLTGSVTAERWTAQYRPNGEGDFLTAAEGTLPPPADDQVSIQCYNGPPDAEHWIRFDDFRILKAGE